MFIKRKDKKDKEITSGVANGLNDLESMTKDVVSNNIYYKKLKKYQTKNTKDITLGEALDDYSDVLSNSYKPMGKFYGGLLKARRDLSTLAKNKLKRGKEND